MIRIWRTVIAIGIAMLVWKLAGLAVPASPWMEFTRVYVSDAPYGQRVPMEVTQSVRRDFNGSYHVVVRDVADNKVICDYYTPFRYEVENKPPDPLDLEWWSNDPRCKILPIGAYYVETTRTIERFLGMIPDARLRVESNVFEIFQRPKGPPQNNGD